MRSADRSGIRWLLAELPELVTTGVLTQETADALRQHYSSQPPGEPRRIGFILSAILGSLLVGAGIILLVAHNWDFLSRPIRCAIAFTPLVLSQALAVFVLIRRNGSTAWRETAAILNVAAIGIAIALASQTYQIQGDFARFILVWMILALPVVYLFRTSVGLSAYFVGAAVWVFSSKHGDFFGAHSNDLWGWLLLLLGVPAFVMLLRQNRNGYGTLLAAGIQAAWVLAALLFGSYAPWKKRESNLAPAAFTPIAIIAWVIAKQTGDPVVPSLLLNFFLLALGVYTLLRGIRSGRVVEANLGMLVIALLATTRFFDTDLEFVVRGVAFIAIGLGFLATNLIVF